MARLQTSFVLGYHGCPKTVGESVLSGRQALNPSSRDYDWLGPGIYFWESDLHRAWEWADWRVKRGDYDDAFVVGAVLDLGNCLDLLARESLTTVAQSYISLKSTVEKAGSINDLPQNKSVGSSDSDLLLRNLDCAVIRHLHEVIKEQELPAFDTVRGLFTEGTELFPGSGFKAKSHVQIAVCSPGSVKGVFRVARPE